jgi:hypothetical protein
MTAITKQTKLKPVGNFDGAGPRSTSAGSAPRANGAVAVAGGVGGIHDGGGREAVTVALA